jgi:hypothetical protein
MSQLINATKYHSRDFTNTCSNTNHEAKIENIISEVDTGIQKRVNIISITGGIK